MWNLLIDPETDCLKIFDFNLGAKLGWGGDTDYRGAYGYDKHRNDVKFAVFTLYEVITRDLSFREKDPHELEASMVLEMKDWEKHPDVRLERGVKVSEYRRVLENWVNTRRQIDAELQDYKQAPESIDWPPLPQFPVVSDMGLMMRSPSRMRQVMFGLGEPFITWYAHTLLRDRKI
jgi:hypothetical protein